MTMIRRSRLALMIGPNEFVVLEFPTVTQTWASLGPVNDVPHWDDGPSGNADQTTHCPFEFYIDGHLADMNRRDPVGPDVAISGMVRFGLSLSDTNNRWQSSFIPTQASAVNWRFVGDSRATYLCNYDWPTLGNAGYVTGPRWKGRQENVSPRYQDFSAHWVSTRFRQEAIPRSEPRLRASIRRPRKFQPSMIRSTMDQPHPRSFSTERCNRSASSGTFSIHRKRPMI